MQCSTRALRYVSLIAGVHACIVDLVTSRLSIEVARHCKGQDIISRGIFGLNQRSQGHKLQPSAWYHLAVAQSHTQQHADVGQTVKAFSCPFQLQNVGRSQPSQLCAWVQIMPVQRVNKRMSRKVIRVTTQLVCPLAQVL